MGGGGGGRKKKKEKNYENTNTTMFHSQYLVAFVQCHNGLFAPIGEIARERMHEITIRKHFFAKVNAWRMGNKIRQNVAGGLQSHTESKSES